MAKDDRPEDEPQPPKGQRRRRPPVLELEAQELGDSGEAQAEEETPKSDEGQTSQSSEQRDARSPDAFEWRSAVLPALAAGGLGAVLGAALMFVVLPLAEREADPQLAAIANEVAALSARIEQLPSVPAAPQDADAIGEHIDRLTTAVEQSTQRLAAIEDRPPPPAPDLAPVAERTAAIEANLKELHAAVADLRKATEATAPAASSEAIETLTGRIGALEERIAALAATSRAAAEAPSPAAEIAALHALQQAIDSGRPFEQELVTVRALLEERAAGLEALEPVAGKGLPTVSAFAQQFSELAPALVRGPAPDDDLVSRFVSNASRLVNVRPVGEPEGTDVHAVVARMETKLGRGDLAGALAETKLLPEHARQASADWIAAATQRREAEVAVSKLLNAALAKHANRAQP